MAARSTRICRQQFVKTTIPETADALAVAAAQIKKATNEFVTVAHTLEHAYDGAADEARRAIKELESTSSQAITGNKRQAQELMAVLRRNIDGCCLRFRPLHTHWHRAQVSGTSTGSEPCAP